jgi:tRNA threonylcarbamoyladenosine biosynthesis protein TsaE
MDESRLPEVIQAILAIEPLPRIILLQGDLGAGKTTLVKMLVQALGSNDAVSSPTYSLVNEYKTSNGNSIFHFDWYRIESDSELYDAGMEEYIDSDKQLIIEWPQVGHALLADENCLKVEISHEAGGRSYKLSFA